MCCVPQYGVPLNHGSKTEDFILSFQSVSWAKKANMNATALLSYGMNNGSLKVCSSILDNKERDFCVLHIGCNKNLQQVKRS